VRGGDLSRERTLRFHRFSGQNARMEATPPPTPGGQYGAPAPQPPAPFAGGKLDTAQTFERIGSLYVSQFPVLLGLALVIYVPIAILEGAVNSSNSTGLAALTTVISAIGQALFTGAVVGAVADMRDGRRDFGVMQLLRSALPFILPLVLAGIVFGVGFVIGLILIVIPGLIFATFFCLYAPAVVVDREGVFGSLGRSRQLVSGNAWRVFGVLLVTVIVTAIVGGVLQRVAFGISDNFVGAAVGALISGLITAPIFAITVSTLYFSLRDAREGTSGLSSPAPPPRV
jgi:hypothetical protein